MTSASTAPAPPRPALPIAILALPAFSPMLSSPAHGSAALPTAGAAVPMHEIVVKGQGLGREETPFSATVIDGEAIRSERPTQVQELFRLVPGMHVRNLGLSGVADNIIVRGFGSGGHGGDVGVIIDGIPLNEAMSHADGYADFNVVVPLEVAAMTVYRGPVSALYGNFNRGGLIALETRKGGDYLEADLSAGSYGTIDAQGALGTSFAEGSQQLDLAAQLFRTDGFRPASDFERGTLAGRWGMDLVPTLGVSVSGRAHHGEGDSASYLTLEQFAVDPRGKDPRVQNDGSGKNFLTLRSDVAWQASADVKLLGFVYGTRQDFSRWFTRPVAGGEWVQREESYDRDVFGAGLNLNGRLPLGVRTLNWVSGIETFRESTDYGFYDNLDQRTRTGTAIYDRTADLNTVSLFGEVEAPLHDLFVPWVGIRHDRFTGDCSLRGAETGGDPCEKLSATNNTSLKFGLRSTVAEGLQFRTSWSEGFALPSNFIKYSAGAADLDRNVFRQAEAGATWLHGPFNVDVAWFHIKSTDEFRTIAPDVYENSGSTRRTGIETSVSWQPTADFDLRLIYGATDTEITRNANPALVGRELTGIPEDSLTLSARYAPEQGWGGSATLRSVGRYAITADNGVRGGDYTIVDLAVGYARSGPRPWRVYLGLDNATDRTYYGSSYISGGTQLVAPAAPRTVHLAAQFGF